MVGAKIMMKRLAVLAVLAVAAVGTAQAAGYDPIETRQAGQDLLAGTFNGIKALVASKGDMKTVENSAKSMARWIKQFPSQFPKGSEEGHNTKALPVIWTDPAGFQKAADELATESLKLVGQFLERAVRDASDTEARTEMMYAAMLSGIAFNGRSRYPLADA